MKEIILTIIICVTFSSFVVAQDIVVLKTGEEIKTTVKKVGVSSIEYVRYDNQGGPLYEVLKDDVFKIKYANGVEDIFTTSANEPIMGKPIEGTFIDSRDNRSYRWVDIGDQRWMGENLNYDDGVSPCPQSDKNECDECGRYYTFDDALVACPEGWHLPTDKEWMDLEIEAGMSEAEAGKTEWRGTPPGQAPALLLKGKTGIDLRMCGKTNQRNISYKNPKYSVSGINQYAYYWTSKKAPGYSAIMRHFKGRASIYKYREHRGSRISVRCVKDE